MNAVWRRLIGGLVAALATGTLAPATSAAQRAGNATDSMPPVECASCHSGVHATMVVKGAETSARCTTCHAAAHAATLALLEGRGGVLGADRMFEARVGCRACHTDAALAAAAGPPRVAAITRACTSCHGARYGKMLPRWTGAMRVHGDLATAYVNAAAADQRLASQPEAQAQLKSAAADLAIVRNGRGVHNVPGADALLRSAIRKAGTAYRAAGVTVPAAPVLGPDPRIVSCAACHYGIEMAPDSVVAGQPFHHAGHVLRGDVACTQCHSSANYFAAGSRELDPRHGKTTVTASECSNCHHVKSALACSTCHDRRTLATRAEAVTLPLALKPAGAPTSRAVAFRHDAHSAVECTRCHTSRASVTTVAACTSCHEAHHRDASDCTACHGTVLLAAHTAANHLTCAQCHARTTLELLTPDRTFCVSCHVDRRTHHPDRECAPCHLQMSPAEVKATILGRQP